jgi:GNAT superfamily N-acetyltransferase
MLETMKSERRGLGTEPSPEEAVKACEENYADYWRCAALSSNADFSEIRGITRCITGLQQEVFNIVLTCHIEEDAIDARIDEEIRDFGARQIPAIWHVGMSTRPKDLGRYLEARGFPHDYDLMAMAVDLESVDGGAGRQDGVPVRRVASEQDCREWAVCLAESWESPKEVAPWMMNNACFNLAIEQRRGLSLPRKMYLASLEGVPSAGSMLFWSNGIAGLQTVGTVHAARRKGVGTAVVESALADARTMGFKHVVVLSTVEAVDMYKRCGFRVFGKLPEHMVDLRKVERGNAPSQYSLSTLP